ncbi:MAG: hypothetical protein IPK02_05245 [Candidatus Accumulibacter sp.]|uniref:Uncharacterized protein n=1 Tax=Candidatus Accumulibacter affinis TaxID=2954384 RepID=A0A935T5L0_9PROT|nr:hypothetical protein [Candidatus Accumulibacter affinis]
MGGMGSGRGYQGGKATTSGCRRLDVRQFQRAGLLTPGHSFGWHWTRNGESVASIQARAEEDRLILSYSHKSGGDDWQAMEYPVRLEWTACTMGGRRVWFLCSANGCGRRVAILYLGGAGIFACRHCYRLAYACQREAADDRVTRRVNNIKRRLGWQEGILNQRGWKKPKGMHSTTFERLTREHDALIEVALAGLSSQLDRMRRRLDGVRNDLHGAD